MNVKMKKFLKYLINNENEIKIKDDKKNLKLLWECCQIPDFVKKSYGKHLEIVKKFIIFSKIMEKYQIHILKNN